MIRGKQLGVIGAIFLIGCMAFLYMKNAGHVVTLYSVKDKNQWEQQTPNVKPYYTKTQDKLPEGFDKLSFQTEIEADIDCRGRKQKHVANVYSRDATKWNRNSSVCSKCFDFPKGNLKTPSGPTPIFVYETKNDIWVSGALLSRGSFESEKSQVLFDFLNKDPEVNLIDFGANLGVYTLSVAKMGRKVLAIEALDRNIQHICASVMEGELHSNIALVYNAISDGHDVVNLGVDKNNMGGTFVDVDSDHIKKLKLGRAQGTYGTVYTITLDDLLDLPVIKMFPKVVIKMDVEGFEAKALANAYNFFKTIKIVGFAMEWEFHRGRKSANDIISFMTEHNFKPYALSIRRSPLNVARNASWGYDVLWLPG